MVNPYSKCFIYKLYADDIDEVYIGSTTRMSDRMKRHRQQANSENPDCYSAILYALSDYELQYEILEECSVEHRAEKEREHMLKYPNRVNKEIPQLIDPSITGEDRKKIYRSLTRDEAKLRSKKSYEKNKLQITARHEKYRQEHKDKFSEYSINWREKNKEEIVCECGSSIVKYRMPQHKKTMKHIEFEKRI